MTILYPKFSLKQTHLGMAALNPIYDWLTFFISMDLFKNYEFFFQPPAFVHPQSRIQYLLPGPVQGHDVRLPIMMNLHH